jgi:hypothetical protein
MGELMIPTVVVLREMRKLAEEMEMCYAAEEALAEMGVLIKYTARDCDFCNEPHEVDREYAETKAGNRFPMPRNAPKYLSVRELKKQIDRNFGLGTVRIMMASLALREAVATYAVKIDD